jgi:hypothetical protein
MSKNDYNLYLELVSNNIDIKDIKKSFFNILSRYKALNSLEKLLFDVKQKLNDNSLSLFFLKKCKTIASNIIEENKDYIASVLIKEHYNEEKDDVKKVQKGFLSSATFYPFFKVYQQFILVLKGDKEFKDINLTLDSDELLIIAGAVFIYVLGKTIKSIYELKKEKEEKIQKEKDLKEKVQKRIDNTLNKKLWSQEKIDDFVKQKMWSKEEMDKWLQDRLWSQENLENMIKNTIKEYKEDDMNFKEVEYNEYFEFAESNSIYKKAKEFMIKIANIKQTSPKIIQNILTNLMLKLSYEDINKILNIMENADKTKINEDVYTEGKVLQSIKDFVGDMFPSLSFYPALGIWMKIDKVIQGGGFDVLSQGELNLIAIYSAIFVGLIGGKVAKNRIKEIILEKKEQKEEPEKKEEFERKNNVVPINKKREL